MTAGGACAGKKELFGRDLTAKLCLGTVQFGMKYGVKNELGRQPTEVEAVAVLNAAIEHGISEYDTASTYGTAEEVLGRYGLVKRLVNGMPIRITSKLRPNVSDDARSTMQEVRKSLRRLCADRIHCYMLHRASDMDQPAIMEGLVRAKADGFVEYIGVSIYEPEEAIRAARDSRIDNIQGPYNVLDRRLDAVGFFDVARANGKRIYARSAFLQGLLLMEPDDAEARVVGSGAYVSAFQAIAEEGGFSPNEAALLYVLSHEGIDYVVFGVDTAEQLRENVAIQEKVGAFHATYERLLTSFADVRREVIVPTRWGQTT